MSDFIDAIPLFSYPEDAALEDIVSLDPLGAGLGRDGLRWVSGDQHPDRLLPCSKRSPSLVMSQAHGIGRLERIPRAAMSSVASGGHTVESVPEEDFRCAA
ncbi:hypothetical protein [Streptomyces cadmiisoli]|uniref:hypothetical protein n=1 Tax=Streptomyces cadmiisoli TaxID=2184053 RepID=UPI003D707C4D